jgi:flagellar L-ring protein precursor FlgH
MKRSRGLAILSALLLVCCGVASGRNKEKNTPAAVPATPVSSAPLPQPSPGSLYSSSGRLADLARDLRANRLHDLLTIIVSDQASAVTTGSTNTSRKSSVANSIAALAGLTNSSGALANLANTSGDQELQGTGTTSRTNTLSTTLSVEVSAVTANGNLTIEGRKLITVNGEKQLVLIRGTVRPDDVSAINTVTSAQVANLEISINGKGVVGDSVRRPFILYRLLLGLLPF